MTAADDAKSAEQQQDWLRWPRELEQRYLTAGVWTDDLLGDIARRHAAQSPERLAVVDGRTRLTYAELEQQVVQVAAAVRARTAAGDRVVVQLPNRAEFVVAILAIWRAGRVPVMTLPAHRGAEIGSFVQQSAAAAYLSTDRLDDFDQLELAARLTAEHPALQHWVVPSTDVVPTLPQTATTWQELVASGDGHLSQPATAAGELALLQLSGGSTGTPKLIPRTHRDYLYSVRRSVEVCEFGADTVQLVALPAGHNFALSSAGVLGALYAGGHVVLTEDPSAATVFDLIERERVTVASVVPPLALLWLAHAQRTGQTLPSLQLCQVGGAKLSEEVAGRVTPELGCRLQQVFGMAEGLVNYTRPEDDAWTVRHTQGRPMSEYDEVLVLDDDDRPVPDGTPGHLVTQGPYTIRSYYRASDLQARSFTPEGWYRTGDLVVRQPTGHLTVVGRAKEQINRGGEKIAAEEVENHLLAHPAVHEASVVGDPDPMLGERILAYLVLTDSDAARPLADLPAPAALRAVKDFLRERGLATFKLPDKVRIVESLPRTGVGKTSTTRLREAAAAVPDLTPTS